MKTPKLISAIANVKILTTKQRTLLKACLLSTLLFANASFAADKALLDMLLKNGTINQAQYDALIKTDTSQVSGGLLDILKQNGAISQDQYKSLAKQAAPATSAPVSEVAAVTPAASSNTSNDIIHTKGGVTEGGAPEPSRIGKEIFPGITATFGGFAEEAVFYRSKNETQDINSNFNNSISFGNNPNAHQTEFSESMRNSRVSMLLGGNYDKNTKLSSYLEMDFLSSGSTGNSNQISGYSPRVRLGYATIDKTDWGFHFLAGQEWTMLTTNKVGIMPRSENILMGIDAGYVPGFLFTRSAQVRFVQEFFDHKVWAGLSLESPQLNFGGITPPTTTAPGVLPSGTVTATNPGAGALNPSVAYSTDMAPDVIAKIAFDPGWGHYEIFGITRFFHSAIVSGGNMTNHTVESAGGGVAAILPVVPKLLDVQMSFLGGSGIGRYSAAQLPDAAFSPTGALVPLTEYTALLGLVAHPDPNWDIFTYLGGEIIDRYNQTVAGQATAGAVQNYGYGNANMDLSQCTTVGGGCSAQPHAVWQITPGFWTKLYDGDAGTVKTGVQYSYTQREGFSGQGGITPHTDQNIVMFSVRYYPLQK